GLGEDGTGGARGVPGGNVAGAGGRDPVAYHDRHAPLARDLELEGVLVSPVNAALIADGGGDHQVELDAGIARSLAHAAHRAVAVLADCVRWRAASPAAHALVLTLVETGAALLAKPVAGLLRSAARGAGKSSLGVHVHVLGRIWLARSTRSMRSELREAQRASS